MNGEVIIANLLPHLLAWWPAIRAIGGWLGFIMILMGVGSVVSKGRQGLQAKTPIFTIIGGVLMLNMMSVLNILAQSIYASDSATGLGDYKQQGADPTSLYITFAIYVVMLVGASGVIYGCILLKRSADENRHMGSAITHLIGGTLAVNIVQTLHMLSSSLGPSVESAVSRLIG